MEGNFVEQFEALQASIPVIAEDIKKYEEKGVASAGRRARKELSVLSKKLMSLRKALLENSKSNE